ncbi:SSI family serine proteinase inhibitor [Streptomyces sp. NPDC048196]|uniref:SSI family serine proteinase inhibitor n=1 Tax=Streptomyces sp. NPDC048196 TaxID=3154712 RepID=UPI0033C7A6A3
MSHRRTSSPFAAAAAAATAVTAVTAATAVLALMAPVASAAPIPLPHYRSGGGVTGAGHHGSEGNGNGHGGGEGRRTGGAGALVGPDLVMGRNAHREQVASPEGQSEGQAEGAGSPGHVRRQGFPDRHVAHHGVRPTAHHDAQPVAPHTVQPVAHHVAHHSAQPAIHHPTHPATPAARRVSQGAPRDHLTVTVRRSGSAHTDGTFELYCHPARGTHHHVRRACDKLDSMTRWGKDPFAPVPQHAQCTMIYGGPATAHVTGTWAGRPVNADFRRTNGCEIERWSRFEPLLPATRS